jgi:tetratricopeptide (TPR) repeat protein
MGEAGPRTGLSKAARGAMNRAFALCAAGLVAHLGFGARQAPSSFRWSVNVMALDVHAVDRDSAHPQPATAVSPAVRRGREDGAESGTSLLATRAATRDSVTVPARQRTPQKLRDLRVPPPKNEWLENQYLALVERYRQGDSHAIADILTWKDAEIRAAIDALSRLIVRGRAPGATTSAGEIAARVKAAAVMLHTDAGLSEILKLGKPESLHLKVAHALMLESAASPFGALDSSLDDFTLRNWVLAAVELLVDQMEYEPARSLLGPGGPREAYRALLDGTYRDLVLTAGWVEESAAFYGETVLTSDAKTASVPTEIEATVFMTRSQQAGRERVRVRQAREHAERLYRRVLQLDDACDEASLRLGRVLFDEGQAAEAAGHLDRVMAHSNEPRQRCLAALFLGALREKEGNIDAAVGLYSKAVAADPHSQTARVAFSAALAVTGRSAPARDAIGPLATRRVADKGYTDPWLAYVLGHADNDRLSQLRNLVVAQ